MSTQRAHYVLPTDLISDIKEIAGPRGSSAFVAETLRNEVRKRKLLEFAAELKTGGGWKDSNHPDLVKLGAEGWVRGLRQENDARLQRAEKARKKK